MENSLTDVKIKYILKVLQEHYTIPKCKNYWNGKFGFNLEKHKKQ
jgi:hypothetical protein